MLPVINDSTLARIVARMRAAGTDSGRCEVKSCAGGLTKDIARTISGLANSAGGVIILGLDEAHDFRPAVGFDASRIQDAFSHVCLEELSPAIHPVMDVLTFEGAPVLVASVEELRPKDKPCFVVKQGRYGGSYLRVGDGDRRLSPYEVDRLLEEREQPRHDRALVVDATVEDLDGQLVAQLIARERAIHPRYIGRLEFDEALRTLGIASPDEDGVMRPTLAGLVALGRYPQEFYPALTISFTSYYTTRRDDATPDGKRFLDSHTCVGAAPAMIEEAVAAVLRNTRTGARIEGLYRRDVHEYPLDALREALVNAVMHRDYSPDALGSSIHLDLFPDRLEIINPGGLFGIMTIDSLGTEAVGSRRNSRLAAMLESTPSEQGGFLAENRGSGYRAMQRAFQDAGLPEPLPRDSISRFSLTLFGPEGIRPGDGLLRDAERSLANPANPSGRSVVRMSGPYDVPTALGMTEREVLDAIRSAGEMGTAGIVRKTGRSRPTVLKALRDLVARGFIAPTTTVKNDPHLKYRLS